MTISVLALKTEQEPLLDPGFKAKIRFEPIIQPRALCFLTLHIRERSLHKDKNICVGS
uniref:Uncharacterized protein n=1 Tax=Anguilla anguilla TaxID=7936 RepID=A0A0E9VAX8_ANGAN